MSITVKVNQRKLNKIKALLQDFPKGLEKVVTRAINKTSTKARTQIARELSQSSGVKAAAVRKGIYIRRASWKNWQAVLNINAKRIPLINFKARQIKAGVSYTIDPASGRKIKQSAFIAVMPTGHKGVYMRAGNKRFPIYEQYGPSIGGMFEFADRLSSRIIRQTYKELNTQLDIQVGVLLSQARRAKAA